jgi:hypothetical protein
VYQSYLVTNLRQLSNHPWLRSTFQRLWLIECPGEVDLDGGGGFSTPTLE